MSERLCRLGLMAVLRRVEAGCRCEKDLADRMHLHYEEIDRRKRRDTTRVIGDGGVEEETKRVEDGSWLWLSVGVLLWLVGWSAGWLTVRRNASFLVVGPFAFSLSAANGSSCSALKESQDRICRRDAATRHLFTRASRQSPESMLSC